MVIKAKRYSPDFYRLLDGDQIVGFASRLTNNRWIMVDPNDKRIGMQTYDSPTAVAADFTTVTTVS